MTRERLQAEEQVCRLLREGDNFLVASHVNPDGDAVGSMAAMGFLLQRLGKRCRLYNPTGVPRMFDWLELPGPVATDLQGLDGFAPDWLLAVDTSAPERLGQELQNAMDPQRTVNIDHHSDNPLYAAVNWVDPERAAVGEMVGGLAKTLGVPLSGPLGEAVYLALVTDTGYFSYDNTTAATMELAAELLRQGLNPGAFGSKHLNQWTVARLMLFSRVLGQTAFHCHGRVGVIRIPDRLFQETGAGLEDTDGLVDQVRRVKDVQVAISLREDGTGGTKFSLRSTGDTDVQRLAARFQGGGHRNAAGGRIPASMDEAERRLVESAAQMLDVSR